MKPINVPMIELLLMRLSKAKEIEQIVVTPRRIHVISCEHGALGYACETGSENDVSIVMCKRPRRMMQT